MDGEGGEHNYASYRTKQMRSLLTRASYPPGTDPRREDPSRTSHTPVNTLHQTHETKQVLPASFGSETSHTQHDADNHPVKHLFYKGLDPQAAIEGAPSPSA